MGETVSRMVAYLLVIVALLVMVMTYFARFDTIIDNNVYDKAVKFVNECQTTGVIGSDNYLIFTRAVGELGSYTITLEYDSMTAYPDLNDDGSIRSETSTTDYFIYSNDEIIATMYPASGYVTDFEMKNGDMLTCVITRKPSTVTRLIGYIFRFAPQETQVCRYTGTIGN